MVKIHVRENRKGRNARQLANRLLKDEQTAVGVMEVGTGLLRPGASIPDYLGQGGLETS